MAKLSAHGSELFRYFSTKHRGLISVRSDYTRLIRYPGSNWKVLSRKSVSATVEDWNIAIEKLRNSLAPWKKRVDHLPSLDELQEWTFDSICETTDGEMLEPDYRGDATHGPSWLVALGYV